MNTRHKMIRPVLVTIVVYLVIWIVYVNYKSQVIHPSSNLNSTFLQSQHQRWKHLQNKFQFIDFERLTNAQARLNRTFTFQCLSVCGGLGDRIRGLLMAYLFALLSNRQLVIDMTSPSSFDRYFQPNIYEWIPISKITLEGNKLHLHAIDHNKHLVEQLNSTDFIQTWSSYEHIVLATNMDLLFPIFSNPHLQTHPVIKMFTKQMSIGEANIQTLFSILFEALLKPTDEVVRKLDDLLADKIQKDLVCIHLRIGKNPSNPRDSDLGYSANITKQITDFILGKNLLPVTSTRVLFVSSDSINGIEQISQSFPNRSFSVPGPILQIDLPASNVNYDDGFMKVVLDFYLFGECHTSILTNSGFSAFANRRRINPYQNLYKYNTQSSRFEQCMNLQSEKGWEIERSMFTKLFCPIMSSNKTIIDI